MISLGYLHGDEVSGFFCESLTSVVVSGLVRHVHTTYSGVNVAHGRNEVARKFLDTEDDWLLMVDSDMVFKPAQVFELVESAKVAGPCLMSGLYFGLDHGQVHPHIYIVKGEEFGRADSYPPDKIVPVMGCGAGFLLIHRDVLTSVEKAAYSEAWPWFQETERDGSRIGEDITFAFRAIDQGFPIWLHTGVVVGHHKSRVFTDSDFANTWGP